MAVTDDKHVSAQESNLRLPSLEIRNFRAFEHLQIEKLGRVNLITGRNNAGKTSLLEAVYLYARKGSPAALQELLVSRHEFQTDLSSAEASSTEGATAIRTRSLTYANERSLTLKHVFHGRREVLDDPPALRIGRLSSGHSLLELAIRWFLVLEEADQSGELRRRFVPLTKEQRADTADAAPYVVVRTGAEPEARYPVDVILRLGMRRSFREPRQSQALFVKAAGVGDDLLSVLWNNIQLSQLEEDVRDSLQIVDPAVERVSIRLDEERLYTTIPIIRLKGLDEPVPLRTMGDGMVRLFGLALALVNARDGFLLVDEIENGLHYSVQADVWRLIFRVASRLNVQVFASTHSWDCITAFQKAAETHAEDGVLVRLRSKGNRIIPTCFTEDHLAVVTRDSLEVR